MPEPVLRLGDAAPNFHARSTLGMVSLSDFRGRWLVLLAHPADFTPVCTSEFIALARARDRFAALDCALMAVSVDSLFSHLAWIKTIHDGFGIAIDFPIAEDPSLVIARAYGMIDETAPDAATMRSTYVIDPVGIIRAITCYPATIGRSVEEILRMLSALQRVDSDDVVTPEGWLPGEDVLLPPAADARALPNTADPLWFYRSRPDANDD